MKIRTYSELITIPTFEERFNYLKLDGKVGETTFGFDRYLNQRFYQSDEWKRLRNSIIIRDNAYDMGLDDYNIVGKIYIHHMNPIIPKDIIDQTEFLLNPEYLISVSHGTHNAIHYGTDKLLYKIPKERTKNDTCPWRR